MLTNYDAKAVAEVMGIAFLEAPRHGRAEGVGSPATVRGAKAVARANTRFDMDSGQGTLRIVGVRETRMSGRLQESTAKARERPEASNAAIRPPSSVLIEKAIEKGLPRLALRHVAEHIAGVDRAKISALEWLIVPKTTLERREEQLSPLESERTERVARLFVHARRALGSDAEAREFMIAPHPQLDGRTPIDAARTDLGTRRAEQILNALEYGLAL